MIPINEMPNHSRVWVYQSDRKFSDEEVVKIEQQLVDFISNWATHGTALKASGAVLYNRFVIIMADEASVKASGCSIDKSVALIKQLEKEFQCDFFNRLQIAYLENNEVKIINASLISEKINTQELSENTLIFNNLVHSKNDFINNWKQPLHKSWVAQYMNM